MIEDFEYDSKTMSFSEKKKAPTTAHANMGVGKKGGDRIGTLSVGILTRKKVIDRKGRKRRVRVEANSSLVTGPGSLTSLGAISGLKKDLGGRINKKIVLNSANYKKIVNAFKTKE
jgi:hypothetical protein